MKQSTKKSETDWQEYKVLGSELGRKLSTKEVAAYVGLDEDTVRKHSVEFVLQAQPVESCSLKKT